MYLYIYNRELANQGYGDIYMKQRGIVNEDIKWDFQGKCSKKRITGIHGMGLGSIVVGNVEY